MPLGPHSIPRFLTGFVLHMPHVATFSTGDRTVRVYSTLKVEGPVTPSGVTFEDGSSVNARGHIRFRSYPPRDGMRRIVSIWRDQDGRKGSFSMSM